MSVLFAMRRNTDSIDDKRVERLLQHDIEVWANIIGTDDLEDLKGATCIKRL